MDQIQTNQAKVMSFGDWMITILITAIPIVNIIMIIVWAVSSTDNPNRVNWARATLAWFAIIIGLYILFFVFFFGVFSGF
ncbi:MAG: hypothetical protein EA359_12895 [Balneolaceae bacterium]|nr:MAG: hypothetical protein EA359_12895 [Balneolaceae bacterium]